MKRLYVIIALLLPLSAFGQYYGGYLELNRPDGHYDIGDTLEVWAELNEYTDEIVEFSIHRNMNEITVRHNINVAEGRNLIYSEICKEEAHYVFIIGEPGQKVGSEYISTVGAIVAPERFMAGYRAPKDLRKFWDKQIAKMRKLPLKASVKEIELTKKNHNGFKCFDIEIPMPEGNPVRAYLAYPENADKKSLPIVIRTHPFGVKGKACQCSVDKTIQDAKRGSGTIALDINAHGMLNGQPQSYYDDLFKGELKNYSKRQYSSHTDFYFRLMYLRLVRALDYLVTLPQWDGERVLVYGDCQGGGEAAALCGIDSRVKAASMEVPILIDIAGSLNNRMGNGPSGHNIEENADILAYYDGVCLLTLTQAKLYFEAGLIDYTAPPGCVATGYYNAASEDKTIVYSPYRPHNAAHADNRFIEKWRQEVKAPREKWINEYLK